MQAYEVDPNRWAYRLAPQLTGRAQQAYAAMPAGEAGDYEALKVAILKRYDISEETYRHHFREATLKETETYRELAIRLTNTLTEWMKERSHSVEAVLEQVAIEQFMSKHIWVQEKKPDTVLLDSFQWTGMSKVELYQEIDSDCNVTIESDKKHALTQN